MRYPEELRVLAKRILWFEPPEESLRYRSRFLAYLMTYGTQKDIEVARRYFDDSDFRAALEDPAPGIFDSASWERWNIRYRRVPVPPLPTRLLPGDVPGETHASLFSPKG